MIAFVSYLVIYYLIPMKSLLFILCFKFIVFSGNVSSWKVLYLKKSFYATFLNYQSIVPLKITKFASKIHFEIAPEFTIGQLLQLNDFNKYFYLLLLIIFFLYLIARNFATGPTT